MQGPQHAEKWANRNQKEFKGRCNSLAPGMKKLQEPVQAAGQLLRKQICRKAHGRPYGHKSNLSQQCALRQQKWTLFQVELAEALPAG